MTKGRPKTFPTVVGDVTRVTAFWNQVEKGDTDDCWPWKGYTEYGYGMFFWENDMVGSHELAITFTTGEKRIKGLDTCHSCDNPICCNPGHLRFDTRKSNVADMVARKRYNNAQKITDEDVVLIRKRLSAGALQKDIANEYGVSPSLISEIKNNKRRVMING